MTTKEKSAEELAEEYATLQYLGLDMIMHNGGTSEVKKYAFLAGFAAGQEQERESILKVAEEELGFLIWREQRSKK